MKGKRKRTYPAANSGVLKRGGIKSSSLIEMKLTLEEIAKVTGGELFGEAGIIITGISGIKEARKGDITFLANFKYAPLLHTTRASAVITSREIANSSKPLIKTDNPSLAFAKVVSLIAPDNIKRPQGIHPTAVISPRAKLSDNVAIGPYAIIEDDVRIEQGTIICGACFIGHQARIGKNCLIYPHVSVRERVEIGERVIIHSGTVVGCDGFGFAMVKRAQEKIPQIGTVVIGDDVEIGANVTIDRARFDRTIIGKGTKIDNLVQIAHNVVIGENCIIVAQAGISGSTTLGKEVILAGQVGVVGHVHIGEGAIVAAQAGVTKSIPPYTKISGYPAKPHAEAKRVNACLQRLPQAYKRIRKLEEKINRLEEKLKKHG